MKATVYHKPTCPYCQKAMALLEEKDIPYEAINVIDYPDERARVSAENNNFPTVPMIFIDGEFVGGYDDLVGTPDDEYDE